MPAPEQSRPRSANKRSGPATAPGRYRERIDFASINAIALPLLPAILRRLLPGGTYSAADYVVLNPTRIDRNAGSFLIRPSGSKAGVWKDFVTGDGGGDVASCIERVSRTEAAILLARMVSQKRHVLGRG